MRPGLAFTLYAPLAAMGDIAVGERRGGFDRPARSAVLGLVAAALGIGRGDDPAHAALDRSYRMAQRVRGSGSLVEDYHTVQAPAADRKARWATRREALQARTLETLLSSREYRADPVVDVVLIQVAEGGPDPEALAEALRRPAYTLSFGRKSCPLGLPLRPIASADVERVATLLAALDETFVGFDGEPEPTADILDTVERLYGRDLAFRAPLYADADLAGRRDPAWPDMLAPDYRTLRVERRRDRVASRRRWQFELRDEIVAEPVRAEAAA